MGNPEKHQVHAPYNFVPFSNVILLPYETAEALPSHGVWDSEKKTGEIHIRMQAETPVFVSNGDKKGLRFFRTPGGKMALPGSTIRGMVRENMQILGFGLVRKDEDVDDYQIFYRDVASASDGVNDSLKKHYHNILGTETKQTVTKDGKSKSYTVPKVPKNVHSGYLRWDGERYRIVPTGAPYLRISRKAEIAQQFPEDTEARTVEVFYREKGTAVTALQQAQGDCPDDMKHGMLLFTGPTVGAKNANPIYLFPDPDPEAEGIPLKEDDVISYKADWEQRKNILNAGGKEPRADFWKLPEEDETEKPVFYTEYGDHVYWGMTLFLRIGYLYPLTHGLPDKQKEAAEGGRLDYPHAILGYANREGAYRSRVSFGDLQVEGTPLEGPPVPMILAGPKPSFYRGYACGKNNVNEVRHYSNEDFQLRGHKLYWLKQKADEHPDVPDGKERVTTTLRPLPKGTAFRGVIRFRNLTEAELGLLLWSLRLDEGCYQSVGMGKPFGYGRMTLTIERLTEYDPEGLYNGSLSSGLRVMGADAIEQYIRTYDSLACQSMKFHKKAGTPTIRSRPEIQDFFYMKRKLREGDGFSYMKLAEYQNPPGTLPTVRELREKDAKAEEAKSHDEQEKQKTAGTNASGGLDISVLLSKSGGIAGANSSASRGGADKSKSKSKKKKKR